MNTHCNLNIYSDGNFIACRYYPTYPISQEYVMLLKIYSKLYPSDSLWIEFVPLKYTKRFRMKGRELEQIKRIA